MVLLRRLADRVGLTGELAMALPVSAVRGWLDRSTVPAQLAIAIVLGAANLSDVEWFASHHRPLGLDGGSGSTMRRLLAGLDRGSHRRLAQARVRRRSQVWALRAAAEPGFPWASVAGKMLTGWRVIDLEATIKPSESWHTKSLTTARSSLPPRTFAQSFGGELCRPGENGACRLPPLRLRWETRWYAVPDSGSA